jgi:Kinesin motor domain
VSVFMFGATGSGKTHSMEGSKTDLGLVPLVADNLFNIMEDKRFRTGGGNFSFQLKIRYIEVADEEVRDLLQGASAFSGRSTFNVVMNEWEGPTVNGVQWVPMSNQHQLADFFSNGCKSRTTKSNEFGRLSEKAAGIFSLELTQVT